MQKPTKAQRNAKLMAEAAAKNGAVARATNAELRQGIYALSALGDQDSVNLLITEEERRRVARAALFASLAA